MQSITRQVWVCGEVLIDLIPDGVGYRAEVGGGPANTAKALARLGIEIQFIDGISNDKFGQMALQQMRNDGVLLDFVNYSVKPTCLASVYLDEGGRATYDFLIDGTATFDFSSDWLPDPNLYKPILLHIGTLVTVIEPASTVLFDWAQKVANFAPIVFDPNVRPAVLNNRVKYLEQVEKWVKISTLVKLSDDDIAWLFPGEDIDEVIKKWLSMGPKLIVVTFGDKGIIGYNKNKKIRVDAEKTVVADTVGAGDTVGAILVEGFVEFGIESLINEKLHSVLNRAAKAAAITVSRNGAHPPNKFEI